MGDPVTFTVYIPALVFLGSVVLFALVGMVFVNPERLTDNMIAGLAVVVCIAAVLFISTGTALLVNGATP